MKAYIVENSMVMNQRLKDMLLEIPGINVIGQADNTNDAIKEIKKKRPDLVLLDIRLNKGGGTGFDVLREIKEWSTDIKVIVLTNYPYSQYEEMSKKLGADYFFNKADDFEKVTGVIKKIKDNMKMIKAS